MGFDAGTRGLGKFFGRFQTYAVEPWPFMMARPASQSAPTKRKCQRPTSLDQPDDLDFLQHSDRPRAALVVRRDDAKRPLIVEERLAVDRVGDDDVVRGEAGIELGQ